LYRKVVAVAEGGEARMLDANEGHILLQQVDILQPLPGTAKAAVLDIAAEDIQGMAVADIVAAGLDTAVAGLDTAAAGQDMGPGQGMELEADTVLNRDSVVLVLKSQASALKNSLRSNPGALYRNHRVARKLKFAEDPHLLWEGRHSRLSKKPTRREETWNNPQPQI